MLVNALDPSIVVRIPCGVAAVVQRPVSGAVACAWRTVAALCFAVAFITPPATAAPPDAVSLPSIEVWAGADATSHTWSLYTGLTYAPFGPLAAEGLRLRIIGGYGEYRYQGGAQVDDATVNGSVTFADLLIGYQTKFAATTIKAFAGINADLQHLDPDDPDNVVSGDEIGWKAVLEGWTDITPATWAALDLSFASAHDSFSSRLRLGYRLWPELSVGVEAGAFGNAESEAGRGGAFVRYEWAGGEISVSAGVSGDIASPSNPYGTLTWLSRY